MYEVRSGAFAFERTTLLARSIARQERLVVEGNDGKEKRSPGNL